MAPSSIRRATERDVPRLLELFAQLSLEAPKESASDRSASAAYRQVAADPRQQLLVLEAGGRVVATLTLIVVPNMTHDGRPYALVENVVVDKAERKKGFGDALMRHAIEEARRAGCYKLALTSNKRRPDAHRFYRRLGLRATSEGFRIDLG